MNNNSNQYIGANQNTFPLCWSAYEILDNGIAIKEKSDVWSFGILMWEIFYLGAAVPYADISGLPALVDYLRNHQRLDKPPTLSSNSIRVDVVLLEPTLPIPTNFF